MATDRDKMHEFFFKKREKVGGNVCYKISETVQLRSLDLRFVGEDFGT